MKKLSVVIASAFILAGCVAVEPVSDSYPLQTEEAVQDAQQTEDVSLSEESPSVIESEPEPEAESVDAPIVEEEVVQEDVQVSEPEVIETPEYDENVIIDAPIVEEDLGYDLSYEIVDDSICKLRDVISSSHYI